MANKLKIAHIQNGFIRNISVCYDDRIPANGDGWTYMEASAAQAAGFTHAPPPAPTAQEIQAAAIAGIYAPVAYNGKTYPVDTESMAKYEMAKQSRSRGKMTKAIAIATDGSVLKLSTAAAIDAFHSAMEDAVLARIAAIHDGIQ